MIETALLVLPLCLDEHTKEARESEGETSGENRVSLVDRVETTLQSTFAKDVKKERVLVPSDAVRVLQKLSSVFNEGKVVVFWVSCVNSLKKLEIAVLGGQEPSEEEPIEANGIKEMAQEASGIGEKDSHVEEEGDTEAADATSDVQRVTALREIVNEEHLYFTKNNVEASQVALLLRRQEVMGKGYLLAVIEPGEADLGCKDFLEGWIFLDQETIGRLIERLSLEKSSFEAKSLHYINNQEVSLSKRELAAFSLEHSIRCKVLHHFKADFEKEVIIDLVSFPEIAEASASLPEFYLPPCGRLSSLVDVLVLVEDFNSNVVPSEVLDMSALIDAAIASRSEIGLRVLRVREQTRGRPNLFQFKILLLQGYLKQSEPSLCFVKNFLSSNLELYQLEQVTGRIVVCLQDNPPSTEVHRCLLKRYHYFHSIGELTTAMVSPLLLEDTELGAYAEHPLLIVTESAELFQIEECLTNARTCNNLVFSAEINTNSIYLVDEVSKELTLPLLGKDECQGSSIWMRKQLSKPRKYVAQRECVSVVEGSLVNFYSYPPTKADIFLLVSFFPLSLMARILKQGKGSFQYRKLASLDYSLCQFEKLLETVPNGGRVLVGGLEETTLQERSDALLRFRRCKLFQFRGVVVSCEECFGEGLLAGLLAVVGRGEIYKLIILNDTPHMTPVFTE